MENLTIRLGKPEEAETIARHRCEMFTEMGTLSPEGYAELKPASVRWFQEAMRDGRYVAWFACDGETIVGGGGMQINSVPPRPGPGGRMHRQGPQGLIVNVYVEKEWRRQGVAEELLLRMVDFSRKSGIASLVLHASDAGRPLYERLGFTPTSEMRMFL